MAPPICLPHAALNDAAFALLEQYTQGNISQTIALTKIDVELAVTGIPFDQEAWLDLTEVILMKPTEGLNSIKTAWQLVQAKMVPLSSLQEMENRFKERYKLEDWKTIFDQVFKASCEGTAAEVVRAAMAEYGVLNPPSVPDLSFQASSSGDLADNVSCTAPSTLASSLPTCKLSHRSDGSPPPAKCPRLNWSVAQFLDVSTQDDEEDESEDGGEDNLDIKVDHHPRVMEIGPSG
ncbi:hypothetical protein F5141DRAFT_1212004 [Pisolithus sp. B1]|nr:hypothetical protein F5141DRAFT_1212004 [Pisolithus sp. B1]